MLNKIRDLIFGLNDYEKNKIENRLEIAADLIEDIKISDIAGFEILEEVIYKIREELRVKSSNLNSVIRNPKRKLRRIEVLNLVEKLNKIKYGFLNKAFSLIEKVEPIKFDNQNQYEKVRIDDKIIEKEERKPNNIITSNLVEEGKITSKQEEDFNTFEPCLSELEELNSQIQSPLISETPKPENKTLLLESEDYKIFLENGKNPFILINFEKEVDLILIKNISSLFFESYMSHGTNILIEKNKALIISRFNNDKVFEMPRSEGDILKNFEKIKIVIKKHSNAKPISKGDSFEEVFQENNEDLEEKKEGEISNDKFIEVESKVISKTMKTSRKEDMSLDSLIETNLNNESPARSGSHHVESGEEDNYEVLEDDKIEVEMDEEPKANPEIEIVKEEFEKAEENNEIISEKTNILPEKPIAEFEIYRDEQIFAYINPNSKVKGEVILELVVDKKINDFTESDFAYISIFSKVFTTITFESCGASGTNLIWNFNSPKIHIIPRFDNDGLNNLRWDPIPTSSEFLDQIKDKLFRAMANVSKKKSEDSNLKNEEIEEVKKESPKSEEEIAQLNEKAKYILENLRRIP